MKKTYSLLILILILLACHAGAQNAAPKMHAHNDYIHPVPFWEAFANGYESIEADVFLHNGAVVVAHEEESISPQRTLEALYLAPLREAFSPALGKRRNLQFLIDIKSDPYQTLAQVVKVLEPYKDLTRTADRAGVEVVISGNRPAPKDYVNYPDYIRFDYQSIDRGADVPWQKVAMVSFAFKTFSEWNGLGRMTDADRHAVSDIITKVHATGKPIRFWATPDISTAWRALADLGVDFINTDHLFQAAAFVHNMPRERYIAKTKTTPYTPTFASDGKEKKIKNVILFIGDGMGLAQVTAGMVGNGNTLSLTQLKNIGLSKTQSADDFTTDSAAGATALSTGKKTKNRYIGMAADATRLENLSEYVRRFQFNTGVITTDRVTGATPSSFYAHRTDRGMTEAIAGDLSTSGLTVFVGAGEEDFTTSRKALQDAGFTLTTSLKDISTSHDKRVGFFAAPGDLPGKTSGRDNYLPEAVDATLAFLTEKKQPFFLMVEGAKVDSGGHANDLGTVVEEMIDMDKALASALRFADANGETLIVVTADHETGGLSLPQGDLAQRQVAGQFQSNDHSAIMVPVFAYGPHAGAFRGVYENTEIHRVIVELLKKYYK
ncbi:alkaline phosphatase [Chryseolinea lacunae]|nr:alkaline phosphatase [Chryseolinea lacunae]